MNISLNFKSQGSEKIELFGKGPITLTIKRYETLAIADLKVHIKMLSFTLLEIKLWLKEFVFDIYLNLFI